MPIFSGLAAIGTAIWGALGTVGSFLAGGSFLSQLALGGLSIAAQYAAQAFAKKKQPNAQQPETAQASQLETRYGETEPRTVLFGMVGTAGHHVYRNAYGPGNRTVQDVYRLADFLITGITRVRVDGVWRDLAVGEDDGKGQRVLGVEAGIWVKVYRGTMDQAADPALIANANPVGRWTGDHRGAGVAYAIVTSELSRELLQQPPSSLMFEVQGAPLYDWRKDTTVGGSGSHRWNDQDTWEWTDNPVQMEYALERGLFNGAEMMVGKGVDASRLPLANWTVAGNICAETVSGAARYRAGCIVQSGSGVTHDANMRPLLEACAGAWAEMVGEEYPIVGAAQAAAFTFTDDDIVAGESFRWSAKRTRSELVNTVAGTYLSPDAFYQSAPLATRIDDDALAADGERMAVSIGWGAVIHPAVGDRLADIAIKASRYQGNGELCLRPKFLQAKPGHWCIWTSARFGWTKTFQVQSKRLGSPGPRSVRNVYLSLQEVSAGIFDPTEYETLPPDAVGRGEPAYQTVLDNFIVAPFLLLSDAGGKFPAIRATWDAIEDPTVFEVELQYRPKEQPTAVLPLVATSDQTVAVMADGVMQQTVYQARYALVARPARVKVWSDWEEVTTGSTETDLLVGLANQQADIRNLLATLARQYREELRPAIERLALDAALGAGSNRKEIGAVVRTARATAAALLVLEATVTENDEAYASALLGVQASVDQVSASALMRFQATVPPPGGVLAEISMMLRATTADTFYQSGLAMRLVNDGGIKGYVDILADRLRVSDGSALSFPFVIDSGNVYIANAFIRNLTSSNIQAGSITGTSIQAGTIAASKIQLGGLTYDRFPDNEITNAGPLDSGSFTYGYGVGMIAPSIGSWVTVATLSTGAFNWGLLFGVGGVRGVTVGGAAANASFRIINQAGTVLYSGSVVGSPAGEVASTGNLNDLLSAINSGSGSLTIQVNVTALSGASFVDVGFDFVAIWFRR